MDHNHDRVSGNFPSDRIMIPALSVVATICLIVLLVGMLPA
ncbi:hypothetical protein [Paenibacillus sp. AD87]|nr:hypothetical protein [Paenibacillus sp. AD87]